MELRAWRFHKPQSPYSSTCVDGSNLNWAACRLLNQNQSTRGFRRHRRRSWTFNQARSEPCGGTMTKMATAVCETGNRAAPSQFRGRAKPKSWGDPTPSGCDRPPPERRQTMSDRLLTATEDNGENPYW